MYQNTVSALIELNSALPAWGIGRTNFYARINPTSPAFDPECPTGAQVSDAANAKRFFTAAEVADYQRILLDRARARAAERTAASAEVAAQLVTARKQRRAAHAAAE
jgi:hypothetical protein